MPSPFYDRQREEQRRATEAHRRAMGHGVVFRDTASRPTDPSPRSHRDSMTPDARREYDRLTRQGANGLGLEALIPTSPDVACAEDARLIGSLA
jgi:hypothetical protein